MAATANGFSSAGIFAGPAAWIVSTQANYALVPWDCAHQVGIVPILALGLAAVSVAGGLLSWHAFRVLSSASKDSSAGGRPRRFLRRRDGHRSSLRARHPGPGRGRSGAPRVRAMRKLAFAFLGTLPRDRRWPTAAIFTGTTAQSGPADLWVTAAARRSPAALYPARRRRACGGGSASAAACGLAGRPASRSAGRSSSSRSSRRCTGSASACLPPIWSSTRSSWRWPRRSSSSRGPSAPCCGPCRALAPRRSAASANHGPLRPSGAGSPIRSSPRSCMALRSGSGMRRSSTRPPWPIRSSLAAAPQLLPHGAPVLVGAAAGPRRERGYGAAVFYLFATALHSGFLGILLSIARGRSIPVQTSQAPEWGLTPLEDQQLAGLVMWVPAGLVYTAAALGFAGLWILHSGSLASRGDGDALFSR